MGLGSELSIPNFEIFENAKCVRIRFCTNFVSLVRLLAGAIIFESLVRFREGAHFLFAYVSHFISFRDLFRPTCALAAPLASGRDTAWLLT